MLEGSGSVPLTNGSGRSSPFPPSKSFFSKCGGGGGWSQFHWQDEKVSSLLIPGSRCLKATQGTLKDTQGVFILTQYWMIYRDQAFSTTYDMALPPPTAHPLPSKSSTSDTQEDWEREDNLLMGWGRRWGMSQIIRCEKAWSSLNHSILSTQWQEKGGGSIELLAPACTICLC